MFQVADVDFNLSATEAAFRDELRAWLEQHCPRDWERTRQALSREARAEALIGWQRQLHAAVHRLRHLLRSAQVAEGASS